jgi:hypothetical protein
LRFDLLFFKFTQNFSSNTKAEEPTDSLSEWTRSDGRQVRWTTYPNADQATADQATADQATADQATAYV